MRSDFKQLAGVCVYTYTYTPILSGERSRPSPRLLSAIPRDARDSLHVDLIRPACTTCPGGADDGALCGIPCRSSSPPPLRPRAPVLRHHYNLPRQRGLRRLRLRTYAEQISLDELPANTPAPSWSNSIQFRRLSSPSPPPPPFSIPFFFLLSLSLFFFSVSLSPDLHDPVSPQRTIDPRLTSFRAVSLQLYLRLLFFSFFPPYVFFPLSLSASEKLSIIADLGNDYVRHPGSPRTKLLSS